MKKMKMAISPTAIMLVYLIILINSKSFASTHLIHQIQDAELKQIRLESILDDTLSVLDSKNIYINEKEKLLEEINTELSVLSTDIKNDSSSANKRFYSLEQEVRFLWATAKSNNFVIYKLETKAQDAEKMLEITKTRVETMAAIVTEQWIQIQHLEQALVIAERGIKVVTMQVSRCPFLKFVKSHFGNLLDDWWEMLERSWSSVKQNHHQLQRFVKNEMLKWKYTASFANKEVVFFVASALITFPPLSFGMFLINSFRSLRICA